MLKLYDDMHVDLLDEATGRLIGSIQLAMDRRDRLEFHGFHGVRIKRAGGDAITQWPRNQAATATENRP